MLDKNSVKKNYLYITKNTNLSVTDSVIVDNNVTIRVTKVENINDLKSNFKKNYIDCLIIDVDSISIIETKMLLSVTNLHQEGILLTVLCKKVDDKLLSMLSKEHIQVQIDKPLNTDALLELETKLRDIDGYNYENKIKKKNESKRLKRKRRIGDTIDLISDIIMVPIMLLTIICCFSVYIMQKNNEVINFMGYSVIEVLSSSMTESGFEVGDNAIIKYHEPQELKVGDIISFYYYIEDSKKFDEENATKLPFKQDNVITPTSSKIKEAQKIAADKGSYIYFHQIVDIAIDKDGDLWFQTKGTSNISPDTYWTRQDYVLGSYVSGSKVITDFIHFITTVEAIVWLLIIPNGLAFMLYMIPFWNYIDIFVLEKKVLKGELSPYEDICIELQVVSEMSNKQKRKLMDMYRKSDFNTKDDILHEVSGMRWQEMVTSNEPKLIGRYKKYFQYN